MNRLGLGVLFCWWWSHCGDLRILQGHSILAFEDGTAVGEGGSLVRIFRELALGIGFGQWAAVLYELEQVSSLLALWLHARGASAERCEFPRLTGLYSGAASGCKAQSRKVCNTQVFTFTFT